MSRSLRFEHIIEAGLDELVAACDTSSGVSDLSLEELYGRVIIAFLRGEPETLQELASVAESQFVVHAEAAYLRVCVQLRVRLRERAFDGELLKLAESLADQHADDTITRKWRGEIQILLATAYWNFENFKRAHELYVRSVVALESQGCLRKALRARMNALVCESSLYPDRNFFARYHDLYRRSLKKGQRELIVATTCLLNISREYQRAGAYLVALKFCDRALALFELQMGEMNYFMTLAHRSHLLCALGRKAEARIDFESAKLGRFKEVEAALAMIEPLLKDECPAQIEGESDLHPSWRERLREMRGEKSQALRLSALEEKFLSLLTQGPQDRIDLLDAIYGGQLDFETKLNRFKSLLSAFRKKMPDLIICEGGQYRLADEILIPSRERASGSAS